MTPYSRDRAALILLTSPICGALAGFAWIAWQTPGLEFFAAACLVGASVAVWLLWRGDGWLTEGQA